MLVFEAEFTDDIEVCLSDEHTAYGWFTKQELDTIQIIPNQIEILKKLS